MTCTVSFKKGALSHADIYKYLNNQQHGAQNTFLGAVRKVNLGRQVTAIHYDLFEPLAQNVIQEICDEAAAEFDANCDIIVIHAYDKLAVGDISIGIGVSTKHRAESYDICRYIIEEVKMRAPIWKKEFYEDGETEWVQGHALCQHNNGGHTGGGKLHTHGAQ